MKMMQYRTALHRPKVRYRRTLSPPEMQTNKISEVNQSPASPGFFVSALPGSQAAPSALSRVNATRWESFACMPIV